MRAILYFMLLLMGIFSFFGCQEEEEIPLQIIPCLEGDPVFDPLERPAFTALHIEENLILNENDSIVPLHGLVLIDPYFLFEIENFTREDFGRIVENWSPNIIRLPIHPDLYHNYPDYLERYVDPIVTWAREMEVYVLVGYHAHGNITNGKSELPSWKDEAPWRGNPYNADKSLAISGLEEMQRRYRDNFWVITSIFNEPAYIGWDDWKEEAEDLIDRLRKIEPEAILMVSGTDFGYALEGALTNPIERHSVIYETHPYPWKGVSWVNTTCELSQSYPVFLGEWGYDAVLGGNATLENYARPLLEHTTHNGIGWTAWIYSDEWRPSLISENGLPNELGVIIRDYMNDIVQ